MRIALVALFSHATSASTNGGRVAVTVKAALAVPPQQACAAWLDYAWARGGGLPGTAILCSDDQQERTLLPVALRERLVPCYREGELAYEISSAGPFLGIDIVEGSHSGKISFATDGKGSEATDMTWDVEFDTSARRDFWESFTRTTVGAVAANLEASLATPSVFTLTARLAATPSECVDRWMACLADGDIGFPLPPPIVLNEGGKNCAGYERLVLPPGLRERVLGVEKDSRGDRASVAYTVVNPSWLTCYPAFTHRGDVVFTALDGDGGGSSSSSLMHWTVAVRPMRFGTPIVRSLTNLIVPAFAKNLQGRLNEQRTASEGARRVAEVGVEFMWDAHRH
jgi:hypothetical protein